MRYYKLLTISWRWGIDKLLAISWRWGIDKLLAISWKWALINYLLLAEDEVFINYFLLVEDGWLTNNKRWDIDKLLATISRRWGFDKILAISWRWGIDKQQDEVFVTSFLIGYTVLGVYEWGIIDAIIPSSCRGCSIDKVNCYQQKRNDTINCCWQMVGVLIKPLNYQETMGILMQWEWFIILC